MSGRVAAVVAAIAVASGLHVASAAGSQYEKTCGTFGAGGVVKAHNTSCQTARHLISRFWVKSQVHGSPLTIDGFACKGRLYHGKFEVNCNKAGGKKLVRWRGSMGRVAIEDTARKTRTCGTINVPHYSQDAVVIAHNVGCKLARRVAKYSVGNGPKPRGWICSASIGRCNKGDFTSNIWVKAKWE